MRKAAVNHYAKAMDEKGTYPMSFSFFIAGESVCVRVRVCRSRCLRRRAFADDSGEVRVVCWNAKCKNVFSSLDIGDIVAVDSFNCKPAFYPDGELPTPLNNAKMPSREYVELAGAHVLCRACHA